MGENALDWGKLEKGSCFNLMSLCRVSNEDFKEGKQEGVASPGQRKISPSETSFLKSG
jgi:hypothetical protein